MIKDRAAAVVPAIRRAEAGDLPAVRWIAARFELLGDWPDRPDFLDREFAGGNLWVGVVDGVVIAFGGVFIRGGVTHLGDLFVLPFAQSTGLGRALLERLLPDGGPRVVFASSDPRAVALYARHGMTPLAPVYYLEGTIAAGAPETAGITPARITAPGDLQRVVALDADASGGTRGPDLEWYAALPGVRVLETPGAYVFTRTLGDVLVVGPGAGIDPGSAADLVMAAVAAHPGTVRIVVPGPHPVLVRLLRAGLRITDTDTYQASSPDLIMLDRYVPSHDLG